MHLAGMILIVLGAVVAFIGELMLLAVAFRKSVWWFLACILLAPVGGLIFLILHWKEGKKPLLITIVGIAILFFGVYVHDGFSITSTLN